MSFEFRVAGFELRDFETARLGFEMRDLETRNPKLETAGMFELERPYDVQNAAQPTGLLGAGERAFAGDRDLQII